MAFRKLQMGVIRHNRSPIMVLAGPGSGKTTVITHRTEHLTEKCGVDSSKILVITFTRTAARGMWERFERPMNGKSFRASFGAFHPVFSAISKYVYRYDISNIARDEQRTRSVEGLMGRLELDVENENGFVNSILTEISSVKGEVVNLEHYYTENCSEEIFRRLYNGYEKKVQQVNLTGFDDMLAMCYKLSVQGKNTLGAQRGRYRYILINEFQDINCIRYETMWMLARPEGDLFIAGDDGQLVYRFRGTEPEIMLGFGNDYPKAGTALLDRDYRSTEDIVKPAVRLIEHNKKRYEKGITAKRGFGRPIVTAACKDATEEAQKITSELQRYVQTGYQLTDIAVLYRTNMNPRLLVERLMEYSIPFHMKDTLPNLYERWITKNILSYIRTTHGDLSRADILQIINHPSHYINCDSLGEQTVSLEAVKSFYQGKNWVAERIEQPEYDLKMIEAMAPVAAITCIRKAIGYDDYPKEYAGSRRSRPEEPLEIPDQLLGSAATYKAMDVWYAHMKEYGERLKQKAQSQTSKPEDVALMVMHSSKELGFQVVYVMDTNEGATPRRKAMLDVDMKEERHTLYVAIIRTKDRLHVYYVKKRYGHRQETSRLIGEYPEPSKNVTVKQ